MALTDNQQKKINRFKKQFERAKKEGNERGMREAHEAADRVRGFQTDPSGTTKTGELPSKARTTASAGSSLSDDLLSAQRRLGIDALKAQRDAQLSAIRRESRELPRIGAQERAGLVGRSAVQARNMAEYIANRGLTSAGSTAQAELQRQGGLRSDIASSFGREAAAQRDLAARATQVEQGFAGDVAGFEQRLLADEVARQDRLAREAESRRLQEAGLTGTLDGELTLAGQRAERDRIENLVQLSQGDLQQAMDDYIARGGQTTDPEYRALQTAQVEQINRVRDEAIDRDLQQLKLDNQRVINNMNREKYNALVNEINGNAQVSDALIEEAGRLYRAALDSNNPITFEEAVKQLLRARNITADDEAVAVLIDERGGNVLGAPTGRAGAAIGTQPASSFRNTIGLQ